MSMVLGLHKTLQCSVVTIKGFCWVNKRTCILILKRFNLWLCCSVTQSCLTLCDPRDCNMTGITVLHHLPNLPLTHVHWCHPTISSSVVPFSSCLQSFPAQGLFQWVGSLYQVAKILELQLQHQSFQWIFRIDFLEDWLRNQGLISLQSKGFSRVSLAPQFEGTSSSALSLFYFPASLSVYDFRKNQSFDYTSL